jgi:CBS domain-containing protein
MEDEVSCLAPKAPVTVTPDTTIADAIAVMLERDIGALLVVDARGGLLGILSERDLLTKVAGQHADFADQPVGDFMTSRPETVSSSDTLDFVLHKMDVGGYRHLPVLTEGKPLGVISVRDMLRHITRLCKEA